MENKYTPGPWITEKSGSTIWIGPNFHRTDGKVELIVTHINIDPEYKKEVLVKNEANAKLIAAAPELLTACQNALCDIQKLNKQLITEGKHGYVLMENELNDVIKKATGC